jgi:cytochrome b
VAKTATATTPASNPAETEPAPPAGAASGPNTVRVWDLPTRLFHWGLLACVIGLVITAYVGGNAMNWHFRFGYGVATLVLFRIVWGLVGGRWSRFASFIHAPRTVLAYARGRGKAEHSIGHSPLGGGSVIALLFFLAAQVTTGMMSDDEVAFAGPLTSKVSNATVSLATNYHAEIGKWILLALVVLHIGAIIYYTRRKYRLVSAMVSGDKHLAAPAPASRDDAVSRTAALLIFTVCGAFVYWISTLRAPAF